MIALPMEARAQVAGDRGDYCCDCGCDGGRGCGGHGVAD